MQRMGGFLLAAVLLLAYTAAGAAHDAPAAQRPTAWVAYWAGQNVKQELAALGKNGAASYFAAFFRQGDELFYPQQLQEIMAAAKKPDRACFLTIVNDYYYHEDNIKEKDAAVLRRLFDSEQSMQRHARQIIDIVAQSGCGGIDLDYENLGSDKRLWEQYAQFIQILYAQAQQSNLVLRVILEPRALDKAAYPAGPQYVLMFYNLYGSHSGPGPKADTAFIRDLAGRIKMLFGADAAAAFACGGYDWQAGGKTRQLSELEAQALLAKHRARLQRDEQSQAVYFTYQEGKKEHQVWFADAQTLCHWVDTARQEGIAAFALWRLGGNAPGTIRRFAQCVENTD